MEAEIEALPRTLYDRIGGLEWLGREFPTIISLEHIRERTLVALREFYGSDSFAASVAKGTDSYFPLAERLRRRFTSLRARTGYPVKDPSSDAEVERVLTSLNHVGASPVEVENYTSHGRRGELLLVDIATLAAGAFGGYFLHKALGTQEGVMDALPFFTPLLTFAAGRIAESKLMYRRLEQLIAAAQKTDTYVHEHSL